MSYQVAVEPFGVPPEGRWDWVIPESATDEALRALAREIAWHRPLHFMAPVPSAPTFRRFLAILDDEAAMNADDYTILTWDESVSKWVETA